MFRRSKQIHKILQKLISLHRFMIISTYTTYDCKWQSCTVLNVANQKDSSCLYFRINGTLYYRPPHETKNCLFRFLSVCMNVFVGTPAISSLIALSQFTFKLWETSCFCWFLEKRILIKLKYLIKTITRGCELLTCIQYNPLHEVCVFNGTAP